MTAGSDSQLSVVRDDDPVTASPPSQPGDESGPARGWPPRDKVLAAGAVLAIALLAWAAVSQYRRAESLAQSVVSLEAELLETSAKLEAYKIHLVDIRVAVGDLGGLLDRLRGLVDRDPEIEPETRPPSRGADSTAPPAQESASAD